MKRLFYIVGCLAAFAGILAGVTSCDTSYRHRGGPFEPDDGPGRGPGDKPDPVTNTIHFEYGYGDYYGQWYSNDTDNYYVTLVSGQTNSEGKFTSSGAILFLDLIQRRIGGMQIESKTYTCSDNGNYYTFIPTYTLNNKDLEGSVLYLQTSTDSYGYYWVTDGSVDISRKITGVYEISGWIKILDSKDKVVKYEFDYRSGLEIVDKTDPGDEPGDNPGDNPGDKPNFPYPDGSKWTARAQYNGSCADNKSIDEYTLFLSCGDYASNGVDFVSSGSEIAIEVLTTKGNGKSIPAGTYTITSNEPMAFRFYDGYENEGVLYPSYLYRQYSAAQGNFSLESITSGNLVIGGGDDKYSVDFYFGTASGSFAIKYEGKIDFYDSPDLTKAGDKIAYRTGTAGRKVVKASRNIVHDRVVR